MYDEAEPLYCRALVIRQKALGLHNLEAATSISKLTVLLEHSHQGASMHQVASACPEGLHRRPSARLCALL
jgi:hypothetical protein